MIPYHVNLSTVICFSVFTKGCHLISLLIKAIGVVLPLVSTSIWSLAVSSVFVGSLALGISSLAAGRTAELVALYHRCRRIGDREHCGLLEFQIHSAIGRYF